MSDNTIPISIRMPVELANKLQRQAERSNLTRNKLIVNLLESKEFQVIDKAAELGQALCELSTAINQLYVDYPEINFESIEMGCNKLWRILK